MKKTLFFAFALAASVLAFTSCNKDKEKEPETPEASSSSTIKGTKFVCDYERGGYARETICFGLENNFDWIWEMFEDEARTKLLSDYNDYGTYELNEEKQYIDMTFLGSFEIVDGERVYHEGHQSRKDARYTYKFVGDTMYLTVNGYTDKFIKK